MHGTFPEASPKGSHSLSLLREQFEKDRKQKRDEEESKRQWEFRCQQETQNRSAKPERKTGELPGLQQRFIEMHSAVNPHQRGRDFELLLVALLQVEALSPRHAINRVGEQIDISFEFGPHTYLVEARWKQSPSEPKELRDFHGKCQGVHVDVRGVFVSVQGYTEGCAAALAKLGELRVVMLDGTHLMSVLSGAISFGDLLRKVVRKACDESLSEILCVRHNMCERSMYAEQEQQEEGGDRIAADTERDD